MSSSKPTSALRNCSTFRTRFPTGQVHEDDIARLIIVASPTLPKSMGALHPAGSLYEKPLNLAKTAAHHDDFSNAMRDHGATVLNVVDILTMDADVDLKERVKLEQLAMECLTYRIDSDAVNTQAKKKQKLAPGAAASKAATKGLKKSDSGVGLSKSEVEYYVGDDYKRIVIKEMSHRQLADVILTSPTVTLHESFRDTGLTATYAFDPATNIVFCRDQQITTCRGVVMSYLASAQRNPEVRIMRFCLEKVGVNVIGAIADPGRLEGGDFIPAGKDLCLLGIGMRSNAEAAFQMMRNDWYGTRRVAVVKDELEKSQDRMHLDTVFNIISSKCVLMLEEMIGEASPTRRVVDEYVFDPAAAPDPITGRYRLLRSDVEFSAYIQAEGYTIIPVSGPEQLEYGCNGLNMGGGRLIAVNETVARRVAQTEAFEGSVRYLDFSGVTAMYGAAHCATQVVCRQPKEAAE